MGTPRAAVPTLERLLLDGHDVVAVYSQPDRPSGRGNKIVFSPVKEFALEKGISVLQPLKIRTPEALETFRSHNADAAVVVAYGRILPEGFLKTFPHGAINVHFSLLPKYRGAAPVNWAIVNGETETGVTTMRMDAGLDTGDLLLQRSTEIRENENAVELMDRLAVTGAELLSETLANLSSITPQRQDEMNASYAPILKKEDGLIDWQMSANDIVGRVRGFQPFPTAFTYYRHSRLTIWRAAVVEVPEKGDYGEIIVAGGKLVISCGETSALSVLELQLEGKRRMSIRDFLNGVKLTEGEVLGDRFG